MTVLVRHTTTTYFVKVTDAKIERMRGQEKKKTHKQNLLTTLLFIRHPSHLDTNKKRDIDEIFHINPRHFADPHRHICALISQL